MVGWEVVPAQAALNSQARGHFPAVLAKDAYLMGSPRRVVAETKLAVDAEITKESIRYGRTRCGRLVRTVERERTIQIVANAAARPGSHPHLVAIILAVPFQPKAALDHVLVVT